MKSSKFYKLFDQQGNALVLSVLILLALSAGGLLSVQRTAQDLLVAGNLAKSNRAWLAAESGLKLAKEYVGKNIQTFSTELAQDRMSDVNTKTKFVLSQSSYSGKLPRMLPNGDSAQMVLGRQGFAFEVEAHYIDDEDKIIGYSHDADICHRIWDIDAKAGIPTSNTEEPEKTLELDTTRAIVLQYRARVLAGPVKCGKPK